MEYIILDDVMDSKMSNILSKYIQAKRNHEYMINQEKQKEQYHSQNAQNLINDVIIPVMKSVCESFKERSGIDCIVTSIVTTDLKNFKFSEGVLFMTNPQIKDESRCYVRISHVSNYDKEEIFSVFCEWNSDGLQKEHYTMDSVDVTEDSICNVILDTIEKNFSREWSF